MRVTKKLRAEAALLCSAAASVARRWDDGCWRHACPSILFAEHDLVRELDVSPEAAEIADAAHDEALSRIDWWSDCQRETWAEAHALLMCDWTPSEDYWR
jgi:hypothetical protein